MKSWGLSILTISKIRNNHHFWPAFTIVELLVVIVVIGILATITIVSYTEITNKATLASLQSDLSNASTQLKMFQTINGSYPTTISIDCAVSPDTATNKCIKLSPGNSITSLINDYSVNNTTVPQTFILTIKNTTSDTIGVVTENSKPTVLVPAPLNPVADWVAMPQGDHYGNYYDTVTRTYATITRSTPKTIYDPTTQHIYDIPANKLAINPWSVYQPDGSGSAAIIEEARTNIVTQSSFELTSGIGSWNSRNAGYSTAEVTNEKSVHGEKSLKITRTATSSGLSARESCTYNNISGLDVNTTYRFSAWTWSSVPNVAGIFTYNASVDLSPVYHSGSGQWELLSGIFVSSATGTAQLRLGNMVSDILTSYYFDAVQIEKGAFATSYIPTTTAAVTRNADVVTIPTTSWNTSAGTFASAHGAVNSGTGTGYLFSSNVDGLNRTYLAQSSTGVLTSVVRLGDIPYNAVISGATGSRVSMMRYKTGETVTAHSSGFSIIRGSVVLPSNAALNTTANIGHQGNGAYTNTSISRLTVYSSALSDSEILSVSNTIRDGP